MGDSEKNKEHKTTTILASVAGTNLNLINYSSTT